MIKLSKKTQKLLKRIRWKMVIPAFIALLLVIYLIISLIVSLFAGGSNKNIDIYNICGYNGKQTLNTIKNEDRQNPIEIKDYNVYGESLNLYFSNYSIGDNSLKGYTIVLKDLCSNKEIRFENLSGEVDNQINLGQLSSGFYSVYLVKGDTTSRVYTSSIVSEVYYSALRNGSANKVELIGDKTLFDEKEAKESVLDNNYLYILVTSVTAEEYPYYDIAIATAPLRSDSTPVSLVGEEENGIVEAKEVYDLALAIKEDLEAAGLKVIIIKEAYDEDIIYYGTNGILYKAYNNKAKYLISLDMTIDSYNDGISYSSYASGELAKSIYDSINATTTLYAGMDNRLQDCGTTTSAFLENGIRYDFDWIIREAGGEVLGAGVYSETSTANSFAKHSNGINTVSIVLCNIRSASEVSNFTANKARVATAIAQGIKDYMNVAK